MGALYNHIGQVDVARVPDRKFWVQEHDYTLFYIFVNASSNLPDPIIFALKIFNGRINHLILIVLKLLWDYCRDKIS